MSRTAYLEPVAAALGDSETSPRARQAVPVPLPVRTVTDTVLEELEYAGHLFRRLQEAVDNEVAILEGAGIKFVGYARQRAGFDLADLGAQVRLHAMLARAGRPS